jgi:hypothetical protein
VKIVLCSVLALSALYGATAVDVGERFKSSKNCRVCHKRIVDEWSHSWHAKSHFQKDEYFRKSLEYISRKTHKSLNATKVQCATCHNPRISVTSTDEAYEIASVMGLNKNDKVAQAVNDTSISEGINCVVCHNIDKIHDEYDATKRGINRVEWTKSGIMTGPYKDAKSPYHKTKHHDFMDKNPNKLCFVCHANDRSVKGLIFTNMQSEYKKGTKSCVSCHMGGEKRDVAATYKINGKVKYRNVRNHGFMGGHTASMWKDALALQLTKKSNRLAIDIINSQPHNIPSGFGSRELLVYVVYKNGNHILEKKTISLTRHYTRRGHQATIAHLAKKQSVDASIPAKGHKVVYVENIKGSSSVEVSLYYRLVNDEVRSLLELKESIFSKKYFITSQKITF